MKKEKGFTLIEVLVAIVILGIISSIALVTVQSVLRNGRNKYYKSLREMIIAAAKDYYSEHKNELPVEIDDSSFVTVKKLEDEDYLDKVKDANGRSCNTGDARDNNGVTVVKISAKEYDYILDLSCPADPKMPKADQEEGNPQSTAAITFKDFSETKRTVKMCVNGRNDYNYELQKGDENQANYKRVRVKKGNLKDSLNCITISLNEGSGCYKVIGRSGDNVETTSANYCFKTPTPSCEGLTYKVNRVAKEWFKDNLEVKVTLKDEVQKAKNSNYENKYFIDKYEVCYGTCKSGDSKTAKAVGSSTQTFNFANRTEKSKLVIKIYNDAGDPPKECSLGEYYSDNTKPSCTNIRENRSWTNSSSASVSVDCNDNDNNGVNQSGCDQVTHTDSTEGKNTTFTIKDKVGNTNSCTVSKMIDRTRPYCTGVSSYSSWSPYNVARATCQDNLSNCTQTSFSDSSEGRSSTFYISDYAGNTNNCTADKKRDQTPPQCVGYSSRTKQINRTIYKGKDEEGNSIYEEVFDHWETSASVSCNDNNGRSSSDVSGCRRSSDSSTVRGTSEPRIRIYDNANNYTDCPSSPKSSNISPAACPTITYKSGSSSWTKNNVTLKITTNNSNTQISNWPSEGTSPGRGKNLSSTFSREGKIVNRTYKACVGSNCVSCVVPNVKIDRTPPSGSSNYQHSIRNNSTPLCNVPGTATIPSASAIRPYVSVAPGSTTVRPSSLSASIRNVVLTDNLSGIAQYKYYFAAVIHWFGNGVNGHFFPAADYRSYCDNKSCADFTVSSNPTYLNAQNTTISVGYNSFAGSTPVPAAATGWCWDYAVSVKVRDAAGNEGSLPSYGTGSTASTFNASRMY